MASAVIDEASRHRTHSPRDPSTPGTDSLAPRRSRPLCLPRVQPSVRPTVRVPRREDRCRSGSSRPTATAHLGTRDDRSLAHTPTPPSRTSHSVHRSTHRATPPRIRQVSPGRNCRRRSRPLGKGVQHPEVISHRWARRARPSGLHRRVRFDTEHVGPGSHRAQHLVVLQPVRIDEDPQVRAVTNRGRAVFGV